MSCIKMITKYSLVIAMLAMPAALYAQGPGFDEDVADTPIDGGVTLITAAAAGYGIKRWRDARKDNIK